MIHIFNYQPIKSNKMSSSTKCGVITRRSSRNSEKYGVIIFGITQTLKENIKLASTYYLPREVRMEHIADTYTILCELFQLYRINSICYTAAKTTKKCLNSMFSTAFKRIPIMMAEIQRYPYGKGYYNALVSALSKFRIMYKKSKNSDTYKAVLFSRVEVPIDIFRLIMEYYIE
jgi:hypothetical protein